MSPQNQPPQKVLATKRRSKRDHSALIHLYRSGVPISAIMKELGIPATTIYRRLAANIPEEIGNREFRKPIKTFTQSEQQQLVQMYRSFVSMDNLAAHFRTAPAAVMAELQRVIPDEVKTLCPRVRKLTPAMAEQLNEMYMSGVSITNVASAFKVSGNTVRTVLKRFAH